MSVELIPKKPLSDHEKQEVFKAIRDIFAEFELVFHNQYNKAFPTEEKLNYAKKIWYSNLCHLPPEQIRQAASRAIHESEFLPTIRGLLKYTYASAGLPDVRSAYIEACQKPAPKSEQTWSHPAVYYAGKASDWFFLASNEEKRAFPVFKRNYEQLCERVINGEALQMPIAKALPASIEKPLTTAERKSRLQQLRAELKI